MKKLKENKIKTKVSKGNQRNRGREGELASFMKDSNRSTGGNNDRFVRLWKKWHDLSFYENISL